MENHSFNIDLAGFDADLSAETLHKPGAVRLDGYPLLTYAPAQHGPGIFTEDGKASVEAVAAKVAEMPDYGRLAAHFGTSEDHVRQAVAYAAATHEAMSPATIPEPTPAE